MPIKERLNVTSGIQPPPLRPGASPVSQYVRPPGTNRLSRLAEGLAAFSPGLTRLSANLREEQAEQDKAEGEARAREILEEGKTYRDAIREGLIRPDQSPWFRVGAKEVFGLSAATTYAADLEVAVREKLGEVTDLEEVREFEREFRDSWRRRHVGEERDLNFENAFGRQSDALVGGMYRNWAVQAGQNLQRDARESFHQRVFGETLRITGEAPADTPPETVRASVAAALQAEADRMVAMGMNPRSVNETLVEAITGAAMRTNDRSILAVLDDVVTDKASGSRLGFTSYAAQAREKAEEEIGQQVHSEWLRSHQVKEEETAEQTEKIMASAVEVLITDPAADVRPFAQQLARIGKHAEANALFNYRENITAGINYTDEDLLEEMTRQVWRGEVGISGLVQRLGSGLNREGFSYLLGQVNQRQAQADRAESRAAGRRRVGDDPAFNNDGFQQGYRTLSALFGAEGALTHEQATAKARGMFAAETSWWDYYHNRGGKDASYVDQRDMMNRITEQVRRDYALSPSDAAGIPGNPLPPPRGTEWETRPVWNPGGIRNLRRRITNSEPLTREQAQWFASRGINPTDKAAVQRFLNVQERLHAGR